MPVSYYIFMSYDFELLLCYYSHMHVAVKTQKSAYLLWLDSLSILRIDEYTSYAKLSHITIEENITLPTITLLCLSIVNIL